MAKAIQNKWDGGLAQDIRTHATNECESSSGFDIYTDEYTLRAIPDQVNETGHFSITDVVPINFSGTTKLVGWGRKSAVDTSASFFTKSTSISTAWTQVVSTSGGGSATPANGTLVEFRGDAYACTIQPNLIKFTSGTTFTIVGTIGAPNADNFVAKPFVHPEDNIMYLAAANTIATYDGTNLTPNVFVFSSKWVITSITSYGGDLAVACKPVTGNGDSMVFIWNRDTGLTTSQGKINWGSESIEILENYNDTLIGISTKKEVSGFDTIATYTYTVKQYSGGYPITLKSFVRTDTNVLRPYKAKTIDRLYFGFDNDNTIYCFGQNKRGQYYVSKERYITPTGSYIVGTINGISIVGDVFFIAYTDSSTDYLSRTDESSFDVTNVYTCSVNTNMDVEDRLEDKKPTGIRISYRVGLTDGNAGDSSVNLSYHVGDRSSLKSILTKTNTLQGNYSYIERGQENGQTFLDGQEYTFVIQTTGDVRVKELKYVYDVIKNI
jgi:hypothetical protein